MPKHLPGSGGADEPSDLEELEKFAKTFKQRRIKLGFTQVRVCGETQETGLLEARSQEHPEAGRVGGESTLHLCPSPLWP